MFGFFGLITLSFEYNVTKCNSKELETLKNAHVNCLLYELLIKCKDSIGLTFGFHYEEISVEMIFFMIEMTIPGGGAFF